MAVYVDRLIGYGQAPKAGAERYFGNGKQSCHMTADTRKELDEFAVKIGLKRTWIQISSRQPWPHYDLTPNKRAQALRAGAIDVTGEEDTHYSKLTEQYLEARKPKGSYFGTILAATEEYE